MKRDPIDTRQADQARSVRYSGGFSDVQEAPWFVLGGGGLKGLAHVGALAALQEAGIRPAGIVGTSIGALIGALTSAGVTPDEGRTLALKLERSDILRFNRRAAWINGIRQVSLFRAEPLRDYYAEILPSGGWSALQIPFWTNAVDLRDGRTAWFGPDARMDLSLVDALYASSALPVFYPPLEQDGRAYIDGGTAHPLAMSKAAEIGAGRIIAVDVGSGQEADPGGAIGQGMLGIHQRVFSIMTYRRRREAYESWEGPPMLYIRPRLDGYGPFGFEHVEYFLEEGYRATKEALGWLGS
ncbi:MAG: patatin-like phospholipase family protein [Gemmatimonadota bacterium]|nr:patatin-like phospholipase family protein [Gemmatimonadota bacterium]